jgi:fructose/tagatose bisphosphate aldolase
VKQRELEREISKWAEHTVQNIATDAQVAQAEQIKKDAERKETKINAKSLVLRGKVEANRRKLEDLKLEHRRAKREID